MSGESWTARLGCSPPVGWSFREGKVFDCAVGNLQRVLVQEIASGLFKDEALVPVTVFRGVPRVGVRGPSFDFVVEVR